MACIRRNVVVAPDHPVLLLKGQNSGDFSPETYISPENAFPPERSEAKVRYSNRNVRFENFMHMEWSEEKFLKGIVGDKRRLSF
jgi:hypothetical protein